MEIFTIGKVLQRLKPDYLRRSVGAAKGAPLHVSGQAGLVMSWSIWPLAPLVLATAAVAVPYLLAHGYPTIALSLQHAFSFVCHQRPARCFWIFGAPVAVCARCLGIYIGAAFGLLLRTSRRIAFQLLIAAAALNLLDGLTEFAGLHGNWIALRFVLGLVLGVAGALLISSSLVEKPSRAVSR